MCTTYIYMYFNINVCVQHIYIYFKIHICVHIILSHMAPHMVGDMPPNTRSKVILIGWIENT
jgi:hypothetical protein